MRIAKSLGKLPGAAMVIPLILGATINTFAPRILEIGSFTTAISHGAMAILGVFFVCMGAEINLRTAPTAMKKGGVIMLSKFIGGSAIGLLVAMIFGPAGILGISPLAIIAAMTNANMGLYAALTKQFGDEADTGAIAFLSVLEGPFLTMVALGTSGFVTIPVIQLVGVVFPILLGMVLGNLDDDIRQALRKGGGLLIPFFAFGLGTGIDFATLFRAGLSGIILGLATAFLGACMNVGVCRLCGWDGVAGAAVSTTAGNAVATPSAIAAIDPSVKAIAGIAAPQIAASTIITSLTVPFITAWVARHKKGAPTAPTAG